MTEALLAALNPDAAFDQPGTRIVVAQVARRRDGAKVVRIEVDKDERTLRAYVSLLKSRLPTTASMP